ncbi:hypothetical protein HZA43_02260 [Candidatus Peregrinibacteria bacterium]|nr:hypothetical protein [Candidatus Peregrinibacteria bacterium]
MEIIIGIIGILFSFFIVVYRIPIRRFMGQIDWAERRLGPGGTYTALLLFGLGLFLASLMIMTGTLGFLLKPLSDLFVIKK